MKHTPGLWIADGNGFSSTWDVSNRNGSICTVVTNRIDADLIAAAPELLEALKLIRKYAGSRDNEGLSGYAEGCRLADLAIAKAEGK